MLPDSLQYNVRESARARNVTLKVNQRQGLVIVVPKHFDRELLPHILSSRSEWIEKQLQRFDTQPGPFDLDWPPAEIGLAGIQRQYSICYQPCVGAKLRLVHEGDCVHIDLPAQAKNEHIASLLVSWLKEVGRQQLAPRVARLSSTFGLPYQKLVVRGQKTRWGSYSSRGTLSLNYKLLFLPEALLEHVILHELVHSAHMNHSNDFWHLLEAVDPQARAHDSQLASGWKYLPPWIE